MFDGCFEKYRALFRLIAQSICVLALVLFSLSPETVQAADRQWPLLERAALAQSQNVGNLWSGTIGAAERWIQRGGEQRRMWVARVNLFELRIERDSSHGSSSWSLTILIHKSGNEEDSNPGAAHGECI